MNFYAPRWRALLLAVTLGGAAVGAHALVNPPIRMTAQGIEYMCGGSGAAEAAFMDMVAPQWAARFQFAVNQADGRAAAAGVKLRVRNNYTGEMSFEAFADSPTLLARLTPGSYTVEATLDGLTLITPISVVAGRMAMAQFVWPSNLSAPVQTQAAL